MNRAQLLNDNEEGLRLALDGRQACIWTACPGIVTAVDFATMTVSVQPAIKGSVEQEDGTVLSVNLPVLINVPIVFPSAGGFLITLPLAVDDEVLVVFASRCIDAWWQSGGIQLAMEARMHDLSDGFAIPGPRSQPNVVGSISSSGAQIRNDAGTTYVEIAADGKIKLVTPSEVAITGNLKVSGTINAVGEVSSGVGVAEIKLTTHTHLSATPGNPTGPPLP